MKDSLISDLMLEPFLNTIVQNASKGIKQRLAIAVALLGEPELVILDEPTSGLDVESATVVREMLKRLKEEGITIIVSSHIEEDIKSVCDRIFFINNGGRKL